MSRLEGRKASLAVLSGVLTALAMPGFGASPLVFVSLVPLFFALEGRRRFLYGLLFGASFFALDLRWILTLRRFSPLVIPGFALLVGFSALFCGAFALLLVRGRSRAMPGILLLGAPAAFTLVEFARARGPLGSGFSALYQSLYRVPALIQVASVLGPWAITALILVANVAIYLSFRTRRARYAIAGVAAVALLAAFALAPVAPDEGSPVHVAAVSSNVQQEIKLDARNLTALADRYESLGRTAIAEEVDLVVFPESILPAYILSDEALLLRLSDLATTGGTRVLFGTGEYRDRRIYNTVALLSPAGDLRGTYSMVRPVPFGEYIPGRRLWEAIGLGSLIDSFLPVDLTPGDAFRPLDGIGTPICFESTFPGPARAFVRERARILAVVTNDAWFVGSSELAAHFATAVFRAVETRRYVIQAANGGVSGIIDPRGRVLAATTDEGIVRGTAFERTDQSLYARWGDLPLLLLLGIGWGIFVAVRVRAGNEPRG